MNVDKNVFRWVYNLIEYGDVYLRLYRESDYKDPIFKKDRMDNAYSAHTKLNESAEKSLNENVYLNVHKSADPYSYYIEMVPDPGTMFELTKMGKTYGFIETPNEENTIDFINSIQQNSSGGTQGTGVYNYKMKSNDINVYQADDFVHACLEDNYTRYPEKVNIYLTENDYENDLNAQAYSVRRGKSLLYDSYKIWREKTLLEDAILLNRLTRSSYIRLIQIEVGDMPKSQVQNTIRRIKNLMEQKSAINEGNSFIEYNNPGPVENNIYLATHGGQGAVTVNPLGGEANVKDIADLDYWTNKYYSSYGIPKQFFGWCLKYDTPILLLDGTTHTIEELFENKEKFIGKGIMGCNEDGSLCPTKISNIILTNPEAKCLRIWLDNEKYVDVTPDHKMMLRDGTFIRADELGEGDSLMPFYSDIYTEGTYKGRRWVLDNKTGKRELQFHVVAEKKFGGLKPGYQIHHGPDENPDKLNDDFDNLAELTFSEHNAKHNDMLHKVSLFKNNERRKNGKPVNANVGGKYITNGIYYTTIKAGEDLPEGFWYEGPKKPESMKTAISNRMNGQPKNYDNTYHLNTPENKQKSLNSRQATYDLKTGRKDFYTRCPYCNKITKRHITQKDYEKYLDKNKFYYCDSVCREKLIPEGKSKFCKDIVLKQYVTELQNYNPEVNHKVIKIEELDGEYPVYDLTVADDCHTFALPCGIFVHNCDDGAGFNGGTSLTILSSAYAKGVKRVQNAILQAITDAINLILINKGCKSYLNNFVLKMKTPSTQEEKDYREELTQRVSAISNIQSLFSDVEDKGRRLELLKNLLSTLNYGSDMGAIIDKEIDEVNQKKAEEEAAAVAENGGEDDFGSGADFGGGTDSGGEDNTSIDLGSSAEVPMESLFNKTDAPILVEGQDILGDSDTLPLPEDLNKDFSRNE